MRLAIGGGAGEEVHELQHVLARRLLERFDPLSSVFFGAREVEADELILHDCRERVPIRSIRQHTAAYVDETHSA
jgi:hypothetical protein